MEPKKKKNKEKKIYRLMVIEEKKYKPLFSFVLTKVNMLFYFGGSFLIILIFAMILWRYTPLNNFLPRYENTALWGKLSEVNWKIDSLQKELALRDQYFQKLRIIINGGNLDSIAKMDSSVLAGNIMTEQDNDSILKKLLQKTENTEFPELSQQSVTDLKSFNFVKPVEGVVSNNFNPSEGHYGIDIVAKEKTPVVAVLPGTVILATWSVNTGYIIEIQHANNVISVYKHNAELLKKEGDIVKAGEAIALMGNSGELSTGPHLHFELWIEGTPVNPADYIVF